MKAALNERTVMSEKLKIQRSFRPWGQNQQRLELADKLGFNVSELINEVLDRNLPRHLEEKTKELREALALPIR